MITQSINLNLISGQVLPRVNASQYDSNTRTLNMYLYDGELAFNVPSGVSGYIQGTKPDRTGFQYAATVTTGSNVVTFDVTEQMTAVAGEVVCELVLVEGSDRIATVNFILFVERAALSDDTIISETELPLIEEAAELGQQIGGFIEQMDADAAKSEAFGAGTVNGVPVTSDNPAYENNAKYYSDEAAASASGVEQFKKDSEAYAVGTRNGTPVASGDPTYRNNSKFYANAASGSAATAVASETAAAQSEEDAEAWAVGERDGEPVTSGDATYHNNSKYYAGEAADSAINASTSETNAGLSETAAAQSEEDAEAWANGTRNGTPVASGDAAYHNNAKYWAGEASGTVNDMVGATASADGVHGLVPQPLMGDQDKFLGGDGNWKNLPVSNRNLLDNPWFTVNQRGQSSYYSGTTAHYGVDRWIFNSGQTATVSNNGISVDTTQDYWQRLGTNTELYNSLIGKTVTMSALLSDGTIIKGSNVVASTGFTMFVDGSIVKLGIVRDQYFDFIGVNHIDTSITLRAVKLELGSVSTLANDTAPNYQQELAKCQRYYFSNTRLSTTPFIGSAADNNWLTGFSFPVTMRISPIVSIKSIKEFSLNEPEITSGLNPTSTPDGIANIYKQSAFTQGKVYYVWFEASADL